jgi:hypothetical protein
VEGEAEGRREQQVEAAEAEDGQGLLHARETVAEHGHPEEAARVHDQEFHQHHQHQRLDHALAETQRLQPRPRVSERGERVGQRRQRAPERVRRGGDAIAHGDSYTGAAPAAARRRRSLTAIHSGVSGGRCTSSRCAPPASSARSAAYRPCA